MFHSSRIFATLLAFIGVLHLTGRAQSDSRTMLSPYASLVSMADFDFGLSVRQGHRYPASIGFQAIMGYQVNQRFTFGFGFGVQGYGPADMLAVPLFLDARVHFPQRQWTPYLALDAGYAIGLTPGTRGGVLVSPTLGGRFPITDHWAWSASVGYRWQGNQGTVDGELQDFRPDFVTAKAGMVYRFGRLTKRFMKGVAPRMKDKSRAKDKKRGR